MRERSFIKYVFRDMAEKLRTEKACGRSRFRGGVQPHEAYPSHGKDRLWR